MIRRLRLISGTILFVYLVTHTLPLLVGNHSLEAMEAIRPMWHGPWESWLGLVVLYGAFAVHMGLAFQAIYTRRRWRDIRVGEAVQLITGIAVPMLLALHLVSTRLATTLYGIDPDFPWIMAIYFQQDTIAGMRQATVLLVAWVHGCMGMYFWLRLKPIWLRARFFLFGLALLWPALAFTGFYNAGTEAADKLIDPGGWTMVLTEVGNLDRAAADHLYSIEEAILLAVVILVLLASLARFIRQLIEKRRGLVILRYDDGTEHKFNQGLSLLEASAECNYPHASVCGGRGRCSTCRVRVRRGHELLTPPSPEETKVLRRVRAAEDVRLACQSIPQPGCIDITPLLPPTATARQGHTRSSTLQGKEQTIAVMFCDLRGFTKLSEHRLPYDTVFLLNRYFDAMGKAIEESGGHLDKFIGDGIMALFGIDKPEKDGCREALTAAKRMSDRLCSLNDGLKEDLPDPLRIGIGIHVGTVIVGEMGYGRATQLTAIGDAVNTASRLEAMTKEYGAELVASRAVFRTADVPHEDVACEAHSASIRGRERPINLIAVKAAKDLDL